MSVESLLDHERHNLHRLLNRSDTTVLFFIERTPCSPNGCKCKSCDETIRQGKSRLALNSSMINARSSDFYHVACFEEIADFSQANFLDRINPLTRQNFHLRGLRRSQILDGNYFCQGAVERLVYEWKVKRGRQIDERDGIVDPSHAEPQTDFMNLLQNAGSAAASVRTVPELSRHEFFTLCYALAPFESDGPGDTDEWNLFRAYLNAGDEQDSLEDRHSLSNMLRRWERDSSVVLTDEEHLGAAGRQRKSQLSEKAIRAIMRLATIPMPDVQSAMLGRPW